jgi:NAD(P)-dependent dehydrogenase (short-subunit alcohol dehydrogenase family)
MATDQTTQQDPRTQFKGSASEPEQAEIGHESQMAQKPDYGLETYRGSGRLTGKATLITGGDSGIGRAVALAFAREGADVLISYLPEEEEDAQEALRAVRDTGRAGIGVAGDIQQEAQCQALVRRAIDEFGQLDVLVNNAAFQMSHEGIEDLPAEEFDRTFRTNVYAMYYLCKAALPKMHPGSAIINTASIQAYQPTPSLMAYAATKGAIVTFSKALAQEAITRGIRVNVVAPGPVWTPLMPATTPPEQVAQHGKSTPIGRTAQPAELAPVYVFLASQESSYVVGEVIGVTGGKPLP